MLNTNVAFACAALAALLLAGGAEAQLLPRGNLCDNLIVLPLPNFKIGSIFRDKTCEQIKAMMGTKKDPPDEEKPDFDPAPPPDNNDDANNDDYPGDDAELPESYNWATVRPDCFQVDSQESCGSCWAWATSRALSQRICIASDEIKAAGTGLLLAPQDMVDCSLTPNGGCGGGYLENAWADARDLGVRPEACVPYTAVDTANCPPTNSCTVASPAEASHYYAHDAYSMAASNAEEIRAVKRDIWRYGPVTMGLEIYDDLLDYESGVYVKSSERYAGGHAVVIVGWGKEGSTEYWTLMNSWGSSWGENGYGRIRLGTDECSIESWSGAVAGRPLIVGIKYETNYGNTSSAAAGERAALWRISGIFIVLLLVFFL